MHTKDGFVATEEQIRNAVAPETTDSYCPIPHGDFVDLVREKLPRFGLEVTRQEFGLAAGGDRFFGVLDCQAVAADFAVAIGLRSSYDRSMSAGIAVGSRVFVCDNICFSGEIVIRRKHTSRILHVLPGLVEGAVSKVPAFQRRLELEVSAMRQIPLPGDPGTMRAHHVICEAVRESIIPVTHVRRILKEWHEPRFDDFTARNVWSLLNAFTTVNGERKSLAAAQASYRIQPFFVDQFPEIDEIAGEPGPELSDAFEVPSES